MQGGEAMSGREMKSLKKSDLMKALIALSIENEFLKNQVSAMKSELERNEKYKRNT